MHGCKALDMGIATDDHESIRSQMPPSDSKGQGARTQCVELRSQTQGNNITLYLQIVAAKVVAAKVVAEHASRFRHL
eukprot:5068370-Amphidinium_carterae.1